MTVGRVSYTLMLVVTIYFTKPWGSHYVHYTFWGEKWSRSLKNVCTFLRPHSVTSQNTVVLKNARSLLISMKSNYLCAPASCAYTLQLHSIHKARPVFTFLSQKEKNSWVNDRHSLVLNRPACRLSILLVHRTAYVRFRRCQMRRIFQLLNAVLKIRKPLSLNKIPTATGKAVCLHEQ
jgi:hypothetical protein